MANVTAAEVNKLRQMTGAGMMDCKNALVETDGDFEKAIDYLRKKGQKVADKRADREATEGYVIAKTNSDNTRAAVVKLSCETDFVARNEEFVAFAHTITDLALSKGFKTLEELLAATIDGLSVQEQITNMIGKIGEKIEVAQYEMLEGAFTMAYNHHGNKLATTLLLSKAGAENLAEAAKDVAMQIAAMAPVAIDKDGVSQDIINREIEIGKDQARQEGKAEEMLERIATGKLNKFFKENTLINQEFIKDNKKTVGEYLRSFDKDLTVVAFRRVNLGS
jgi:elongation factor Ts